MYELMNHPIKIRCDGSAAPGASWRIEVEFRPLKRGFSVWLYDEGEVDNLGWQKIGGTSKPLSWRTAYAYLQNDDNLRVFGDLWYRVEIDGIPSRFSDILKLRFIIDEDNESDYGCIGDLLIGFTDDELSKLLPPDGLNPYELLSNRADDDPPLFQLLSELASNAHHAGLIGASLHTIMTTAKVQAGASLRELSMTLHEQGHALYLAQKHSDVAISETFATESENTHCDNEPNCFDVYKFRRKWTEISNEKLPTLMSQHVDLISDWLEETRKPLGGGRRKGTSDGSVWPVLMWLLGSSKSGVFEVLSRLNALRPDLALRIVSEVMARGKSEAYFFEGPNRLIGWAQNMIGKFIYRDHVEFSLWVQSAADQLDIRVDKNHRISALPYLPSRPESL